MLVTNDCIQCNGNFCCRCIVVNIGRPMPSMFKKIDGLTALGNNPFLPLHELLLKSSTPADFYECVHLDLLGRCTIYAKRSELCKSFPSIHDHDMLHFTFSTPWCCFRQKQAILRGDDYEVKRLGECMNYYSDPTESKEDFMPAGTLDSCYRYTNYYQRRKPGSSYPFVFIEEANDFFVMEVFSAYQAHFAYMFHRIDIRMKIAKKAFQKIALLCYKYGVNPTQFFNEAKFYGMTHVNVKTSLPFPTVLLSKDFESFLVDRISKIREIAMKEWLVLEKKWNQ